MFNGWSHDQNSPNTKTMHFEKNISVIEIEVKKSTYKN